MTPKIQPILQNDKTILYPLKEEDFEELYAVASDPKVWEQHPNKDRWKREVFKTFFDGAMQSKGAFKIVDKASDNTIGSTRFYDYDEGKNGILIGYTFYGKAYWGKGINPSVKKLMLDYIFQFV
ncbi:MAG: GNAT family N-acetyltransferase, partial [Bacteroidia bacterium]|nr:GNAT family N-acetyltransferase [Bacteroidia bacterium]